MAKILTPKDKALKVNLDSTIYGSFAEIGAGQEVVRTFFQAGAAAGTIAKSMSAYDMAMSDSLYEDSSNNRYVSQERLIQMLDFEYNFLLEQLDKSRGATSSFFTFANTIAARSYRRGHRCHGWLGVKLQSTPKAVPSRLILHVNLLDQENVFQQQAVGILGVNLIYACFYATDLDQSAFLDSLMEGLSSDRIEIDMITVSGDAFNNFDDRLLSLELVRKGLTGAVLFDVDGTVMPVADAIYKKSVLLLRGGFRPPTKYNFDMLECGLRAFKESLEPHEREEVISLVEISMSKLFDRDTEIDYQDFLSRVDLLSLSKQRVLISGYKDYVSLKEYLAKQTNKYLGLVMATYNIEFLLNEMNHLEGGLGLLGSIGAIFGRRTRAFIYPTVKDELNPDLDDLITLDTLALSDKLRPLMQYLRDGGLLVDIVDYNPEVVHIWSRIVLELMQAGESGWEEMVPAEILGYIKKQRLFMNS
ncbi:MAG: TonB-dependent receptor [Bdellovibrionales bacterium]|nr:TonB-dependent receptor [Bdellovibrionales bacterium]